MADTEQFRPFGHHDDEAPNQATPSSEVKKETALEALRAGIIGSDTTFRTPFAGQKPMVYADWTASARALVQIEDYLRHEVMPLYGNTHTTTSVTGHQSTCFRHESRQIVAQAVNAKITGKAAEDVVIFSGNGTTSCVDRLVSALGLNAPIPEGFDADEYRPVVFTSSYEHHSNLLPWRESCAEVVTVNYHPVSGVDVAHLQQLLTQHQARRVKIGAMSAASNVTGMCTDVDAVSIALHAAGALAFFDYATAAPYVVMDMNPLAKGAHKDAIYFSGHKFLGGPGAPGVLIVKRAVMPSVSSMPSVSGGGTVFYVTKDEHRYLSNREEREEGGTPDILGDIRLGLVVQVKESFGSRWVETEELRISRYIQQRLEAEAPNMVLMGRLPYTDAANGSGSAAIHSKQLPVFSFLIRCGTRFLHHNFVCALLNDLFGVQSRGGCQCAGPFSQQLLGLSDEANAELQTALLEKNEVLRPGYSRLSFPFWLSSVEVDYIIHALVYVSKHAKDFLFMYRYNHRTGEWAHTTRLTRFPERKWLGHFNLAPKSSSTDSCCSSSGRPTATLMEQTKQAAEAELAAILAQTATAGKSRSKQILKIETQGMHGSGNVAIHAQTSVGGGYEHLRWFVLNGDDGIGKDGQQEVSQDSSPLGPVQPDALFFNSQQWDLHDEDTEGATDADNAAQKNAYAKKRDGKLRSTSGGGRVLPRYLHIFDAAGGGSAVPIVTATAAEHGQSKGKSKGSTLATVPVAPMQPPSPATDAQSCLSGSCPLPSSRSATVLTNSSESIPLASEAAQAIQYTTISLPQEINPIPPPKKLMKVVGQCIADWNMIEEGDRVCLGLSGGKDSISMLHILMALKAKAPVNFTIACATVDPQTSSFDPSPMIPYLKALGITYHYLSQPIIEMASTRLQGDSLCAFCARFKRGLLYSCCRENKYNKLVLAQHLDDLAESFLMSVLHNGQLRTMKANYLNDAGDVTIIRPLSYARESMCRDFAKDSRFPVINENCPACFEEPKERARVKQLLAQEESMVPSLFFNMRKALLPLMVDETYVAFRKVTQMVEERAKAPSGRSNRGGGGGGGGKGKRAGNGQECAPADSQAEDSLPESKKAKIDAESTVAPADSVACSDGYCVPCYELC